MFQSILEASHAPKFQYMRQERTEILNKYGALFYCLKSNSKYLASLIFASEDQSNTLLENAIIAIYNYISTKREEVRALKCIKTALSLHLDDPEKKNIVMGGIFIIFSKHSYSNTVSSV